MTECGCVEVCRFDGWGDQFQPATRELMVFTKSTKRFFDLDAVRGMEPEKPHGGWPLSKKYTDADTDSRFDRYAGEARKTRIHPAGAPPLDWWLIPYTDPPEPQGESPDMTATFYVGDAIETMGRLPEKSVDLVLTSPPFLALRSYLPQDHPDKALEGGSQATPGEYVDWLLDVVEACARVLAPHGSLVFELGDTYSGSSASGGDWANPEHPNGGPHRRGLHEPPKRQLKAQPKLQQLVKRERRPEGHPKRGNVTESNERTDLVPVRGGTGWPLAKSLSLIPESFRWAMVYGHNPFTGRTTEPWRLRNVIRWVRPNPPVGALGDKFRPATSELMVFCKAKDRYFDLDAVRSAHTEPGATRQLGSRKSPEGGDWSREEASGQNPAGAPPLDWWSVPLLEGEPTKYGPKRREDSGVRRKPESLAANPSRGDYGDGVGELMGGSNPLGAPPLDWWNIPLLEGEEPTRYGPKERPAIAPRGGAPKARQGQVDGVLGDSGIAVSMVNATYETRGGAPPLDWWNIPPGGYPGAHYAVWPPELLVKPIKAMCPETVCRTCGEPRRRIVEQGDADYAAALIEKQRQRRPATEHGLTGVTKNNTAASLISNQVVKPRYDTLGFSDCGHADWRPGLILDPFAGSGTTLAVATGHGRDAIGIDLDARNFDLALDRVGPLILELGSLP